MSTLPLTILHLQCFVHVAEAGSFAQAARQLGLSTSNVSKTISRMEKAKGVRLLNRSTHSLSLTPEGEELISVAREATRSFDQAKATLDATVGHGVRGRVRISAPTSFLRTCLIPLLPTFRSENPDILLDLRGSDHMVDLAEGGMDLVLRSGLANGISGHLRQSLLSFSWVVIASPDYLEGRDFPSNPDDLAGHDLIGFRNQRTGAVDPWRFRDPAQARSEFRLKPDAAIMLDDGNAVARAAIAGVGIACTPSWLVSDALREGRLRPLLTDWSLTDMNVFMIRRPHANTPDRVMRVMLFLKHWFANRA